MAEPRRSLLLVGDQGDPFVAGPAKPLPHVGIPVHTPRFFWRVERLACGGANAVGEALVVPEGGVLQDKPSSGFAEAAVSLALVSMAPDEFWRVKIAFKPQLLL